MSKRLLVCIVEDDYSVREALPELVQQFGFETRAFSSAEEFLASDIVDQVGCLILDIGLPGMSGPELQQQLQREGRQIPIIFITGQPDEISNVLTGGAVTCLLKPFTERELLDALAKALPGSAGSAPPPLH